MSENPLVEVRDLARHYRVGGTTVHALDGVSLQIAAGEALAVVGRSGSGKSTLLHLLGGLERPTAGQVTVDGHALHTLRGDRLARFRLETVGFIFQSFHLIPHMSVLENVVLPLRLADAERRTRHKRALELLERVGLTNRSAHLPSQLSGGERQRVAVARALVNGPRLLLADEPTGNLDSTTSNEVMALIGEERRHAGASLVLVTHEHDLAAAHADRLVELRDGRVVTESSTTAVGS